MKSKKIIVIIVMIGNIIGFAFGVFCIFTEPKNLGILFCICCATTVVLNIATLRNYKR